MRAAIAYYMMILYCTVMFKPLIPIIKDKLSHTFAEAIHIATVHVIYGTNHLQKEVDQTNSDAANGKHQNNNNEEPVHVLAIECKYDFCNAMIRENCFTYNPTVIVSGFISRQSPPPKFS